MVMLQENAINNIVEKRIHEMKLIANKIHYPDCWDTITYPTLEAALLEIIGEFICDNDYHSVKRHKQMLNQYASIGKHDINCSCYFCNPMV